MKKYIFIFLIIVVHVQNASAKEVFNLMQACEKRAYVNFEFDPISSFVAGYARTFEIKNINRSITFTGDITLPIFLTDLKHYRAEAGSRILFFDSEKWNILNRLSVINPNYSQNKRIFLLIHC